MQNFEVILDATAQGAVGLKAHNLTVNLNLDEGNVTIEGKQTIVAVTGREVVSNLNLADYAIRTSEVEALLAAPTANDSPTPTAAQLSPEHVEYLTAKKAIFDTYLNSVKQATEALMQAKYLLDNSVSEAGTA